MENNTLGNPCYPNSGTWYSRKFLDNFFLSQFSHSVMSNSLWPYGWQHARLPCPSPTPRACSNPCPLSGWCHPTISSSVIPSSSCLLSFPASGSFPFGRHFPFSAADLGVSSFDLLHVDQMKLVLSQVQNLSNFMSINPQSPKEKKDLLKLIRIGWGC